MAVGVYLNVAAWVDKAGPSMVAALESVED